MHYVAVLINSTGEPITMLQTAEWEACLAMWNVLRGQAHFDKGQAVAMVLMNKLGINMIVADPKSQASQFRPFLETFSKAFQDILECKPEFED